jgi:hypothetical protein
MRERRRMLALQLKRYFLNEIERIRMENVIVEWVPGSNRLVLEVDDAELVEIYKECLKEDVPKVQKAYFWDILLK